MTETESKGAEQKKMDYVVPAMGLVHNVTMTNSDKPTDEDWLRRRVDETDSDIDPQIAAHFEAAKKIKSV